VKRRKQQVKKQSLPPVKWTPSYAKRGDMPHPLRRTTLCWYKDGECPFGDACDFLHAKPPSPPPSPPTPPPTPPSPPTPTPEEEEGFSEEDILPMGVPAGYILPCLQREAREAHECYLTVREKAYRLCEERGPIRLSTLGDELTEVERTAVRRSSLKRTGCLRTVLSDDPRLVLEGEGGKVSVSIREEDLTKPKPLIIFLGKSNK
tara:strand:- start:1367 stop:1981 length:615 start_codon:yes stop_codon:yes gene_type:complete